MTVLKNIGYTLIGLIALAALLLTVSYFWPASALQKQARAALEAPADRPGSNGWVDLETLLHEDIDAAQRQALVDAQTEALHAWAVAWTDVVKEGDVPEGAVVPPMPVLGGQATGWQLDVAACQADGPCLPDIRDHQHALAAAFGERPALFERIDAMSQHGHLASPYPSAAFVHGPMPPVGVLPRSSLRHALRHLDGQSIPALEGLCRDMGTARMLASEGDSLLLSQVGVRWLQSNAQLVGEILAELPGDAVLPGNCAAAMAPLPAQVLGQCNALAGEYRFTTAMIDASAAQITDSPGGVLFFNPEKTHYRQASVMGQACTPAALQQLANDQRWVHNTKPLSPWRLECAANAIGCIHSAIAAPAYDGYINRGQDADAQLRLLRAAVWLRESSGDSRPVVERLKDVPQDLGASPRAIRIGGDGKTLEIDRHYREKDAGPLRLPLQAESAAVAGMH